MSNLDIKELAKQSGKSERTIYCMAKKLNRLPTIDEILAVKVGRPKKYK